MQIRHIFTHKKSLKNSSPDKSKNPKWLPPQDIAYCKIYGHIRNYEKFLRNCKLY
jgi:hypothetical protein